MIRLFPTGGKAHEPCKLARSGVIPEPTVKSGWKKVYDLFRLFSRVDCTGNYLIGSIDCPEEPFGAFFVYEDETLVDYPFIIERTAGLAADCLVWKFPGFYPSFTCAGGCPFCPSYRGWQPVP
jgi:hypothetical protein